MTVYDNNVLSKGEKAFWIILLVGIGIVIGACVF